LTAAGSSAELDAVRQSLIDAQTVKWAREAVTD
jgi:hypothetical protein